MDLIDKKILCELDLNCRAPLSQIAKKLRINRNVLAYRIKNLENKGIIKKYICSINLGYLGYKTYKIHFKIKSFRKNLQKKFIKNFIENNNVISFLKTEGAYDYSVSIAVKNIRELDSFLMDIKNEFKDFIKEYVMSIVVYSDVFKLNKLLLRQKQQVTKFEKYSAQDKKLEIDDRDVKILKEISQLSNLSIIKISEKTGLSVDIIKYRLKKLDKKLINSFRAIIDFSRLGYYNYAIMLKLGPMTKAQETRLKSWCSFRKDVLYFTKRIGEYDFIIGPNFNIIA
jgi:DNA-binding Lrp family transcriptional regulator